MTWPGWSEVLPLLAVIAVLLGGLAALARLARPWMREAAKDATEALYERLKSNDFKHLEDRIGEGLRGVNDRLGRVEAKAREDRAALRKDFGDRLDRAREDRAAMEARILAALGQPAPPPPEDSPPPG